MVPTLTCGLSRSNFSFATFCSLLYRLCARHRGRTGEIYLNALFVDCWLLPRVSDVSPAASRLLGRHRLPGALLDDLLGDVRRNLFVVLELHRIVRAALRVGAQVGRIAEHLAERHARRDGERVAARLLAFDASAAAREGGAHRAE